MAIDKNKEFTVNGESVSHEELMQVVEIVLDGLENPVDNLRRKEEHKMSTGLHITPELSIVRVK